MRRIGLLFILLWFVGGWGLSALAQFPSLDSNSAETKLPAIEFLATDNPETKKNVAALRSLFYRQPLSFDMSTLSNVWQDFEQTPVRLRMVSQSIQQNAVGHGGLFWGLVALGLVVFILSLYWLDSRMHSTSTQVLLLLPVAWPFWLRHLTKIALVFTSRVGLLLVLLLALHLGWGSFVEDQFFFPLVIDLTWLFLFYRGIQTVLYEVLMKEKETLFPEAEVGVTERIYRNLHGFALYSLLFWNFLTGFKAIRYNPAFIEFLYFSYACSGFLLAAYLLTRKSRIFNLLPNFDEPVYQRFIFIVRRFYTYISAITLFLGLFWLLGYRVLSELLFLRSWAIIGVILGVRLGHRFLKYLLKEVVENKGPSKKLLPNIFRATALLEILILFNAVLSLLGLRAPLFELMSQPLAAIGDKSVISLISFINGILTLVLFWFVVQILIAYLEERIYPNRFDVGVQQMITLSVFYVMLALGILISLNIVGVDLSVFAIFAGALAFGIGFGLQGIAKNFASGIILIFTGLVKKGDYITIGGKTGYIQDVSWKKVHLKTPDHVDLIIPTVDMVESTITNWTYSGKHVRMHIPVGVSYSSDMEQVKQALLEAAKEHKEVMQAPEPEVWMTGFGDSSVDFDLLVWINCTQITQERLRGELNFMIWNALKRYQIEIPFPQRDLHLRSGWELLQKESRPESGRD